MSSRLISLRSLKSSTRPSLLTVISVAIVAYAASDVVHEVIGHGSAALMLGIKVSSISSVGLQSYESSRVLSAAGSIATILAGVICLAWLRSPRKFGPTAYFLWLFGFLNLMNGTCYLLASALLNNGDWSVVITGLNPGWAWRTAMGLLGLGLYLVCVRWAATVMVRWVQGGEIRADDLFWLTIPAYLAGGILMTMAAVFNPFSPSLILISGVGASLGLTWGLLLIPGMVGRPTPSTEMRFQALASSYNWAILALIVTTAFVAVFGPGFRFA